MSVPNRIVEQAKYFHITIQDALQIGLEAERFTRRSSRAPSPSAPANRMPEAVAGIRATLPLCKQTLATLASN